MSKSELKRKASQKGEPQPEFDKNKQHEDEEDTPHEGLVGYITQLDDKPVKKKKNKIGFY